MLKKKLKNETNPKKNYSMPLYLGMGKIYFKLKFNQMNTTKSYGHPNRPSPMNHCHCNFTN